MGNILNRTLSIFLVLALVFQPLLAEASRAKRTSKKKLSSLILPYNQIVKMSAEDQVKYFMLLHSLIAQIEMRQIFHYTKKNKTKAFFDFIEQNLNKVAHAQTSNAGNGFPIITQSAPIRPNNLRVLRTYGNETFQLTRAAWDTMNTDFLNTRFEQDAFLTAAALDIRLAQTQPGTVIAASPQTASQTPTAPRTPQVPLLGAPEPESVDENALDKIEVTAPNQPESHSNDKPASTPVYKKEGAACIFAGHFSKYKTYGGKLYCEQKGFNNPNCGGTKQNPKVSCYTFNLKKSTESDFLACVDYSPVKDLTKRCNEAFIQQFEKSLPTGMNAEEYEKWSNQIKSLMDDLTKQDSNETTFYTYCLEDNKINENIQKDECKSIWETVDRITKLRDEYQLDTSSDTYNRAKPAAPTTPRSGGSTNQ